VRQRPRLQRGTGRGGDRSPGIVFLVVTAVCAYASDDGAHLSFDTNKEFQTVNGVKANGAAMDGPGAAVSDGMLRQPLRIGREAGQCVAAFGVE
jgi:hypothetical protein